MANAKPSSEDRPASVLIQRRIEWSDTDASGNYHNTAAFRLLEAAETLMLSRLGILGDVYGRLPRVHIEADFRRPIGFHDKVDVELRVAKVGRTSATYEFEIRRDGETCVAGRAVVALLTAPRGEPTPWSDGHRRLLLTSGPQTPELLTG